MINTTDFVAFGKANLEAVTASGKIWTAGMQDLSKQFAATAKASYEQSVASFNALRTAKSVNEAVKLQGTFAKTAASNAVAESKKLAEASLLLTKQTLAPLTARVTATVGSLSKAA